MNRWEDKQQEEEDVAAVADVVVSMKRDHAFPKGYRTSHK